MVVNIMPWHHLLESTAPRQDSWGVAVRKDFPVGEVLEQGGRVMGTRCCPHRDREPCESIPGPLVPFSVKDRLVPKVFGQA